MKNTKQKESKSYLQSLRIQRFRSIEDLTIDFAPITIFVGANDSGKSNILKAVNLFFKNEVEPTSQYEHSRDYFKHANKGKGYSDSVALTARINFPHRKKGTITASRYWKEDGFSTRNSKVKYNPEIDVRSNIPNWFDKLNYHYVPANKGDEYMKNLMRDLYKLYAVSINNDVRSGAIAFIKNINKETSTISDEIKDTLGLDSRIQLPEDISTLFELFDFETDNKILLKQRGDGIRVRHIPAILNFLADPKKQPPKSVRGDTIWGYEEPENNLELMAAFEQAKQFVKYSSRVQILITTHSPAFYQMIAEDNCKGYYVDKGENNATRIREITKDDINHVNEGMGLMPLVAPYIRDKQIENNNLLKELKNTEWVKDRAMIVVEGEFDKAVFEYCMEKMNYKDIYIHAADGADKVGEIIKVRRMAKKEYENCCVGLLDKDDKGRQVQNKYKECDDNHKNWLIGLNLPTHMYELRPEEYKGTVAINLETFLPLHYWEDAKKEGLLEFSDFFNNTFVSSIIQKDEAIDRAEKNYPETWIYICYKVKTTSKDKFKKLVMSKLKEENELPPTLKEEVNRIVEFLQGKQNPPKEKG